MLALALGWGLKAQKSDIMPDFTGTTIDGTELTLYDILDAGQAVFINFFVKDVSKKIVVR